ncbi:MAG: outer membrane protein transport protein [Betaproteobacteria bacterium]|nr:outer membrane protein transport protein [Betaproteobacteria bacterium]
MKTFSAAGSVLLLSFPLLGGPALAGGLSTPGQGARALGVAGAFTAVADDGSAVYYNPAGISQIDGTSIETGLALISPQLGYQRPEMHQKQAQRGLSPRRSSLRIALVTNSVPVSGCTRRMRGMRNFRMTSPTGFLPSGRKW